MDKKKILITGASGFVGGFLVEEALRRGYEVWAGVRLTSNKERLKDERLRFINLAYQDVEKLTNQLKLFVQENGIWDYVIHNAGLTKTLHKADFFKVNAEHTRTLLTALSLADCKPTKFLLMSSLSSFGPGDEKGFTPIRANDPQTPNTAYGKSKALAEEYVRSQIDFPYVILRPTGIYGPGDKDYFMEIKSIQSGFDFAVGYTPQQLTFIYVKDLANLAFQCLEREHILNKAYFVADGDVYTDTTFAQLIKNMLGKKWVFRARIPAWLVKPVCFCSEGIGRLLGKSMTLNTDKYLILKQRNWICDITPLQDDLNFTPIYNLEKGLQESIEWYRRKGWL
ncbi:NAD(P)-dependent oxidoreductase [Parabacteroides sp. PF5-9]|uniref:NAD-dependent epimerase/dehydratase family protein n=1 Tax=Parabacteroides sp. PF5-9 TaxID=1742404 RepID=UPI002476F86F|nr:NAD(P)-dependent oxidoreductase [Parabacteroides sp. PF5-9]MDH6357911.1 UDP-glucose 4-epimerase [Parabacteroides sp. PF5-9]